MALQVTGCPMPGPLPAGLLQQLPMLGPLEPQCASDPGKGGQAARPARSADGDGDGAPSESGGEEVALQLTGTKAAAGGAKRRGGASARRVNGGVAKEAPRPRVDYVQRQREYFDSEKRRAKQTRVASTKLPPEPELPDLKTALAAVARRDETAVRGAARSERIPSVAGALPRTPPSRSSGSGAAPRTPPKQARRGPKRVSHMSQTPPRTPPQQQQQQQQQQRAPAGAPFSGFPTAPGIPVPPQALPPIGGSAPEPALGPAPPPPLKQQQQVPLPPIAGASVPAPSIRTSSHAAASSSHQPPGSGSPHAPAAAPARSHSPVPHGRPSRRLSEPHSVLGLLSRSAPQSLDGGGERLSGFGGAGFGGGEGSPPAKAPFQWPSVLDTYQKIVQVDTSQLFLPDSCTRPDDEPEEQLAKTLPRLKNERPEEQTPQKQAVTYSHLVKAPPKSAVNPYTLPPRTEDWVPAETLAWANKGVGPKKMELLRDMLMQNTYLTGLQLAGNVLNNDCVSTILSTLSQPGDPAVRQLDLSSNPPLDWRCAYPLVTALGAVKLPLLPEPVIGLKPSQEKSASCLSSSDPAPPPQIRTLELSRLVLSDVKLGDKGATALAAALEASRLLKDLNLSRCSIGDHGGAALLSALANGNLVSLDLSWNCLMGDAARALHEALQYNGSLQSINLSYNGLNDTDVAKVLSGLCNHGTWRHADLSYNNLGAGSALVIAELSKLLGKKCAQLIVQGKYMAGEDAAVASRQPSASGRSPEEEPDGDGPASDAWSPTKMAVQMSLLELGRTLSLSRTALMRSSTSKAYGRSPPHEELGAQLTRGPVVLNVCGNPIGVAGLREVLHSLDWTSCMVEDAVAEAEAAAPCANKGRRFLSLPSGKYASPNDQWEESGSLPPWPLQLLLYNCNVDYADAPLDPSEVEGMDPHSPNPFVPSLWTLAERVPGQAQEEAGPASPSAQAAATAAAPAAAPAKPSAPGGKKGGKGAAAGPDGPAPTRRPAVKGALTCQSQRLDLACPAGRYVLDMEHPASALLISQLLSRAAELEEAARRGLLGSNSTALTASNFLRNVAVNGRACNAARLAKLHQEDIPKGRGLVASFTLNAPAVVSASRPAPVAGAVVSWVLDEVLRDDKVGELWKLSVLRAVAGQFHFTWEQTLQLLQRCEADNMAPSLRLWMGQMMYVRCINPVIFWLRAMPQLPRPLADALSEELAEYPALDMNNPAGRYTLTLSRTLDRMVALRLQDASIYECRVPLASPHFTNWRNVSLDGCPLRPDSFKHLRKYTVPESGSLRLDYVTYRVPEHASQPCSDGELKVLLTKLRAINNRHEEQILKLGEEYGPYGQMRVSTAATTPARAYGGGGGKSMKAPAPAQALPPVIEAGAAWPASRTLSLLLRPMAAELRSQAEQIHQSQASRDATCKASAVVAGAVAPPPLKPTPWWLEAAAGGFKSAGKALMDRAASGAAAVGSGAMTDTTRKSGGALAEDAEERLPLPPPSARAAGVHMSERQAAQAEELTSQLLRVYRLQDAACLLSRYSAVAVARLLHTLMKASPAAGPKVAGALLECLAPTFAIRFLHSGFDQGQAPLLSPEARATLAGGCRPELLAHLGSLHGKVNTLAVKRSQQVRVAVHCFAAAHLLTTSQAAAVLRALRHEQDRCAALVALWSRIVDREYAVELLQMLSAEEQRQAMHRLGYWHIWATIQSCPHDWGALHLYLDLRDPDQKDVAREIVKMACKATTMIKAQDPTQQNVRQLLNLAVDGVPSTIEEDANMWASLESRCTSMEFDVAPSLDQVEMKRHRSAVAIQRMWRRVRRMWRQRGIA